MMANIKPKEQSEHVKNQGKQTNDLKLPPVYSWIDDKVPMTTALNHISLCEAKVRIASFDQFVLNLFHIMNYFTWKYDAAYYSQDFQICTYCLCQ